MKSQREGRNEGLKTPVVSSKQRLHKMVSKSEQVNIKAPEPPKTNTEKVLQNL